MVMSRCRADVGARISANSPAWSRAADISDRADVGGRPAVDRALAKGRCVCGEPGAGRDAEHHQIGRRRAERSARRRSTGSRPGHLSRPPAPARRACRRRSARPHAPRDCAALPRKTPRPPARARPILVLAGQGMKPRENPHHRAVAGGCGPVLRILRAHQDVVAAAAT